MMLLRGIFCPLLRRIGAKQTMLPLLLAAALSPHTSAPKPHILVVVVDE